MRYPASLNFFTCIFQFVHFLPSQTKTKQARILDHTDAKTNWYPFIIDKYQYELELQGSWDTLFSLSLFIFLPLSIFLSFSFTLSTSLCL